MSMRLNHGIVAIGVLIILLLPCLTFLEFVELTTFHDDPSNAFILKADSIHSSVVTDGCVPVKAVGEMDGFASTFAVFLDQMSPSEFSSAHSPQDLLALFSLRRT